MVGLDRPSWMTGIADAEYLITSGGKNPGGSWRSCCCSVATTWAMAVGILALGWKKILMTDDPVQRLGLDVLDVGDGGGEAALVDRA